MKKPIIKERISDLTRQGIKLAIEAEKLKRKIREYIEKIEELERMVNDGS